MDFCLRSYLPNELVHNIMKDVHQRYMRDLAVEIENNVCWIRTKKGEYSFLIGKTSRNPFYPLTNNIPANFKSKQGIANQLKYNYFKQNNISHNIINGICEVNYESPSTKKRKKKTKKDRKTIV